MSVEGIKIAAKIFNEIQVARHQLMDLATKNRPIDRQDLLLSQLLEKMKESTKDEFSEITKEPLFI